jgi:hypothetical protein
MKALKIRKLNQSGFSHHYIIPVIVVAFVAFVGVHVYQASHAATPDALANTSFNCGRHKKADPTAAIEALPSGATWNGDGKCYKVVGGIKLTQPVTLQNAAFVDTARDSKGSSLKPIIYAEDTNNVNLINLALEGQHTATGYSHAKGVGQEGIKLYSCVNCTITNVDTVNTYGDGLLASDNNPKDRTPTTNLNINGLTVTNTGRQGVSISDVYNSTLSNVNIVSSADTGWDFESDIVGVGPSNVTINNPTGKGVRIIETLNGPLTFNNVNLSGNVSVTNSAAASGQPVTFNKGNIQLKDVYNGTPPAGIWVNGPGNLTFNNLTITREAPATPAKPILGLAWLATKGAHLTFNNTTVATPNGTSDSTSKVVGM